MSGMSEEPSNPAPPNLPPISRFAISLSLVLFAYLAVNLILGVIIHFAGRIPDAFTLLFAGDLGMLAAMLAIYKMLCLLIEDKP
ncbi:MAG: hypothetical protein ACM3NO_02115, partial [Deltaproteobacteria bacterium]